MHGVNPPCAAMRLPARWPPKSPLPRASPQLSSVQRRSQELQDRAAQLVGALGAIPAGGGHQAQLQAGGGEVGVLCSKPPLLVCRLRTML